MGYFPEVYVLFLGGNRKNSPVDGIRIEFYANSSLGKFGLLAFHYVIAAQTRFVTAQRRKSH